MKFFPKIRDRIQGKATLTHLMEMVEYNLSQLKIKINKIIALVIIAPVALYLYIKDRIHNQNEKI